MIIHSSISSQIFPTTPAIHPILYVFLSLFRKHTGKLKKEEEQEQENKTVKSHKQHIPRDKKETHA